MHYSFTQRHLFTAAEMRVAQGWPAAQGLGHEGMKAPRWMLNHGLLGITVGQIRSMTGNGMHLARIGAWLAYCMSNTVRSTLINGCSDDLVGLSMPGAAVASDNAVETQVYEKRKANIRKTRSGRFSEG